MLGVTPQRLGVLLGLLALQQMGEDGLVASIPAYAYPYRNHISFADYSPLDPSERYV